MPQDNNESLNWKDSIVSTITVKGQSEPSFIKIEHKEIEDGKWKYGGGNAEDKESWIMITAEHVSRAGNKKGYTSGKPMPQEIGDAILAGKIK